MTDLVVAVDVGTGSARAGVLNSSGQLLGRAEHPIAINRPNHDHAEHDSEDIWRAVCASVRAAVEQTGAAPGDVRGISFDATCSLVVRGEDGGQVSASTTGEAHWDTIVWLDHRAVAEAEECTATGHKVLDFIGGVMSPEMETPKLMWLKRNLPRSWKNAGYFFDLADFLTWKAARSLERSQCTLTCKWTYLAHEGKGWQQDFFETVGITDMLSRGSLPDKASAIGKHTGPLSADSAQQLGLTTACRVGVGLIDAHAGALGVIGAFASTGQNIDRHLGLIGGTSTCTMALSSEARPVPGVWGPYFGAVLPELWLNEGGQSATGALLDHIIQSHGAGREPNGTAHKRIVERIQTLRESEGEHFAERLHVLPDFNGNRSPLADPRAVGVISGLTLDSSFDSLCRLYWRTCVAIALGVRHILDAQAAHGYAIDTLHVTGGHTRNPLLMELYADATGCAVIEPSAEDAVLLGTGMVAATAAGLYPDLPAACAAMQQGGSERQPNAAKHSRYDRDYRIFLQMHEDRRTLDRMK